MAAAEAGSGLSGLCGLCGKPALFNCVSCERPICEACARDAPGWRFVCFECPVPDPRRSPFEIRRGWFPEEHDW